MNGANKMNKQEDIELHSSSSNLLLPIPEREKRPLSTLDGKKDTKIQKERWRK